MGYMCIIVCICSDVCKRMCGLWFWSGNLLIRINKPSLYIALWMRKVTCNWNIEINSNISNKNGQKNNFQNISN